MIFGITLVPFTFLLGAAIEYSGASDLRTRLQRATDAQGIVRIFQKIGYDIGGLKLTR